MYQVGVFESPLYGGCGGRNGAVFPEQKGSRQCVALLVFLLSLLTGEHSRMAYSVLKKKKKKIYLPVPFCAVRKALIYWSSSDIPDREQREREGGWGETQREEKLGLTM